VPDPAVRYPLFLPSSLYSRMKVLAMARGISLAELIRQAIHEKLDREGM
jgi:Ribbon-helix-helix protein, copG family